VYETVVKQALPTLCYSIESAPLAESWISASAVELVSSLVSGSPESGLGDGFFGLLAPSLFKCLCTAEDRDLLQVIMCAYYFRVVI
jgi:importin-9